LHFWVTKLRNRPVVLCLEIVGYSDRPCCQKVAPWEQIFCVLPNHPTSHPSVSKCSSPSGSEVPWSLSSRRCGHGCFVWNPDTYDSYRLQLEVATASRVCQEH
jgi:hypothetical protein